MFYDVLIVSFAIKAIPESVGIAFLFLFEKEFLT